HVEGRDARPVAAEHALDVLGAVEQVEADVVLSRLVVGELRPVATTAEPAAVEQAREAPGPLGDRAVGHPAGGRDDALAGGEGGGGGPEGPGQVHRPR